MKHILEVIGDTLVIVFGAMSLILFIDILQHGTARYIEPNMTILVCEMCFCGLILLIGLERLIDDLKNK